MSLHSVSQRGRMNASFGVEVHSNFSQWCFYRIVFLQFFAIFECKREKNCTFSNLWQEVKSEVFLPLLLSHCMPTILPNQ
jgi:hypothetical protein